MTPQSVSLRSLFPLALFVGTVLVAEARRSGRAAGLWNRLLVRLLLFVAAATGTTWWFFSSLELLPFVLAGAGPLWFWTQARFGRAFESAWAPVLLGAALVSADWIASSRLDVLAAALVVLAAAVAAVRPRVRDGQGTDVFAARWLPAALGLVSALIVLWVWGSLAELPAIHDEESYLLQANLFANGRWTWPSPPLPQFFEQFHVLLVPAVASKYMPGHALLLSAGALVGLPGLVPLLLTLVTGSLLYSLARRLAGGWVALLAWFLWSTAPGNLEWRATYLSETTTGALWLLGWWALLRWSEKERMNDLLIVAACVGWGAITRPLTGLVFAIPVAAFVLWRAGAHRLWKQVAVSAGLGAAVLGVIPLWSVATTGDWRTTPLGLYTKQYMPYDAPGFGPGSPRPTRALSPVLDRLNRKMETTRDKHTLKALPGVVVERLRMLTLKTLGERRGFLLLFALMGAVTLPAAWRLSLATAVLLFVAYLTYWTAAYWGVYFIEAYPVFFVAAASGLWHFSGVAARALAAPRSDPLRGSNGLQAVLAAAAAVLLLASAPAYLRAAREFRRWSISTKAAFSAAIGAIPEGRAVVFVRYTPTHDGNRSFVDNDGNFAAARLWLAHDRGAENRALLEAGPGRTPYLYDEARQRLCRIDVGAQSAEAWACD